MQRSQTLYEEIFTIQNCNAPPIVIDILFNDVPVKMELDTGASSTLINQGTWRLIQQWSQIDLQPSGVRLKTYTGQAIPILGCATLQVRYGSQLVEAVVQVVTGEGPNLLGSKGWRLM